MYRFLLLSIFYGLNYANAEIMDLQSVSKKTDNNIEVIKLTTTSDASSFVIFVEESVRNHIHKTHTETLYVLQGRANFVLDGENTVIKPGDFINIAPGQVHGVTSVISAEPLKVLSVQSPEFLGKDRHFVD